MKWTVRTIPIMILWGLVGFFGFAFLVVGLDRLVGPYGLLLAYAVVFAVVFGLVVWQSRSKWVERVSSSGSS